ncbi:hypothetical protein M2T82_03990 [Elizabethkingia ursingii]|uniref:hypothetical protein n=1 Tax=Elizabethkingia ursingii TaxID=1756150 RepID=UPI00201164EA|nr:hypothetical protein [Elizabethkingia ursingii]MCL1667218.1 hypothetical protein [Elizabethkingia ursingii]
MKFILPAFIILVLTIRPVLPLIDYAVNYEYISEKLCKNKDKPQLLCNGKCYLEKELAKTSENTPKQNNLKISPDFTDAFVADQIFKFDFFTEYFAEKDKLNSFYSSFYQFLAGSDVFHPPLA